MTEADWLACVDPDGMLEYLRGKASDRKLRLYACACCRRVGHVPWDEASRKAIEMSELYADGLASKGKLAAAAKAVRNTVLDNLHSSCGGVARIAAGPEAFGAAKNTARNAAWALAKAAGNPIWMAERQEQTELLREIVGNPFRMPSLPLMWPPKVSILARAAYAGEDQREALRDALSAAGLGEWAEHFQQLAHPKGCWVLDVILGKS
jgi:hypothetical protein